MPPRMERPDEVPMTSRRIPEEIPDDSHCMTSPCIPAPPQRRAKIAQQEIPAWLAALRWPRKLLRTPRMAALSTHSRRSPDGVPIKSL